MTMKADLHIHTVFSGDSEISIPKLIGHAESAGLGCVAVVDHNTVNGSKELSKCKPSFKVIAGEEILTQAGEIIGYFLTDTIPPGDTPERTIESIHSQGGLACIPHPFDRYRSSAMQLNTLERIVNMVDIIEIANSRTLPFQDLNLPSLFALKYARPASAGSDAHRAGEVGRCFIEISDFDGPIEFLSALSGGMVHRYHEGPLKRTSGLALRLARKCIGRH
jgi:predicted metal-dependent phosphoesterase TrpH